MQSPFYLNPVFYILIVNIIALRWAVRSWRNTIKEKWMNNLRDSASELIGVAESIYLQKHVTGRDLHPIDSMSNYTAKEHKLLLLFKRGSDTYVKFKKETEKLRNAADNNAGYQDAQDAFRNLVSARLEEEWKELGF